jgi:chemotaxis protein histidine kinase CheA
MSPTSNPVSTERQSLLEAAVGTLQEIEVILLRKNPNHDPAQYLRDAMDHLQALGDSLELPGLSLAAHYLQPIFQKIYGEDRPLDVAEQGLIQQSLSNLQRLLVAYLQSDRSASILAEAQPMFDMLAAKSDLPSWPELPLPPQLIPNLLTAEFLPILEQLSTLLEDPQPHQSTYEFCSQLDILRHLGQLLHLPKFVEITQDTLADLRAAPEDLSRIGKVALLRLQRIYHRSLIVPTAQASPFVKPSEASDASATRDRESSSPAQTPLPQTVVDFLASAPTWMDLIEADLFSLKEHGSINKANNLMRNTHTLKGAAIGAELATVRSIAHSLETFFRILCQPEIVLDGHLEVLLFQAYDCLRQSILLKSMDTSITEVDLRNRASSIFDQLQERFGSLTEADLPLPSSSELGVDIVHSIFEMEVEPRLQTLANLIEQQDLMQLAERLKDTSEIFLGISEAFELEGFGAIAHTALKALDYHPDQVGSIAQLALMDFRNGKVRIQAGDREEGGRPSAALQHLSHPLAEVPSSSVEQTASDAVAFEATHLSEPSAIADLNEQQLGLRVSQPFSPAVLAPKLGSEVINLQSTFQDLFSNYYQHAAFHEQLHGYLDQFQSGYVQHQALLTQLYDLTQTLFLRQSASATDPSSAHEEMQDRASTEKTIQNLWELSLNESLHFQSLSTKLLNFHRQSSDLVAEYFNLLNAARNQVLEVSGASLTDTFRRLSTWFDQMVVDYQKAVDLRLEGEALKVDPAIAPSLYDVLLHLLRNAFDHGIESAELRQQHGKPERGQILVQANQQGEQLVVEVRDDGAGIDFGRIGDRAAQLGLISLEDATTAGPDVLLDLIFEPGFSTATEVTDLSGRGVGLDTVRARIQALQGSIAVQSKPEEGTTFTLRIPQFPAVSTLRQPSGVSEISTSEEILPIGLPDWSSYQASTEDVEMTEESMTVEELKLSLEDVFGQNLIANQMPQPLLESEELLELNDSPVEGQAEPIEPIVEPAIESVTEPIVEPVAEPVLVQLPEVPRAAASHDRTLDTKQLFVWQSGNVAFVLPYNCIEEHVLSSAGRLLQVQQQRFLQWRNQILPLYRLSDFLLPSDYLQVAHESESQGQALLLVLRLGQQTFALESTVNQLITIPKLVVKPLNAKGYAPLYIYGQTALEHQSNLILIDAETLLHQALSIPEDKLASVGFGAQEQWNNEPQNPSGEDEPGKMASRPSVLVIDDSKMVREILKSTLEGAGYDVMEAQNGQVAIDLAPQLGGIDLVICDVAMPKMNGFDFLRACRQYPAYETVPVVMLSNCDGEVHQQLAYRLGATAYFTKPYHEQNLLSTIQDLIKV